MADWYTVKFDVKFDAKFLAPDYIFPNNVWFDSGFPFATPTKPLHRALLLTVQIVNRPTNYNCAGVPMIGIKSLPGGASSWIGWDNTHTDVTNPTPFDISGASGPVANTWYTGEVAWQNSGGEVISYYVKVAGSSAYGPYTIPDDQWGGIFATTHILDTVADSGFGLKTEDPAAAGIATFDNVDLFLSSSLFGGMSQRYFTDDFDNDHSATAGDFPTSLTQTKSREWASPWYSVSTSSKWPVWTGTEMEVFGGHGAMNQPVWYPGLDWYPPRPESHPVAIHNFFGRRVT